MIDPRYEESRPVGEAAIPENQPGGLLDSLPTGGDVRPAATPLPALDADALADQHVRGAYCVIVHRFEDRHVRRLYLSLHAAEKAARRATEAGHRAVVILARLEPVGTVIV
ncbi:MAG: hypothetical protein ACYC1Z_01770 [Georgenia sp.]